MMPPHSSLETPPTWLATTQAAIPAEMPAPTALDTLRRTVIALLGRSALGGCAQSECQSRLRRDDDIRQRESLRATRRTRRPRWALRTRRTLRPLLARLPGGTSRTGCARFTGSTGSACLAGWTRRPSRARQPVPSVPSRRTLRSGDGHDVVAVDVFRGHHRFGTQRLDLIGQRSDRSLRRSDPFLIPTGPVRGAVGEPQQHDDDNAGGDGAGDRGDPEPDGWTGEPALGREL